MWLINNKFTWKIFIGLKFMFIGKREKILIIFIGSVTILQTKPRNVLTLSNH